VEAPLRGREVEVRALGLTDEGESGVGLAEQVLGHQAASGVVIAVHGVETRVGGVEQHGGHGQGAEAVGDGLIQGQAHHDEPVEALGERQRRQQWGRAGGRRLLVEHDDVDRMVPQGREHAVQDRRNRHETPLTGH